MSFPQTPWWWELFLERGYSFTCLSDGLCVFFNSQNRSAVYFVGTRDASSSEKGLRGRRKPEEFLNKMWDFDMVTIFPLLWEKVGNWGCSWGPATASTLAMASGRSRQSLVCVERVLVPHWLSSQGKVSIKNEETKFKPGCYCKVSCSVAEMDGYRRPEPFLKVTGSVEGVWWKIVSLLCHYCYQGKTWTE